MNILVGLFTLQLSLEDFQLLDNEPLDKSIIKRDFAKIYHQQGDKLNQSNQNIQFIFGENNNYHQVGNADLEFNITVRKNDDANFHYDDPIRLVNSGFTFCFKEARLSTTIGKDIEINKFCGQVSTIMRAISNKMVIYYLNLIIGMKMIYQFSRGLQTYHFKLEIHLIRKC